ncbi:AsmA family protein [Myxococcus sp. MISCRS1]|uniref:AsmA family protein n=1 Tax=Myxococcus sp. MISCRS1 TaxID=2996786 RepID=UPI0022716014|nr:AsmA-like C-terminal region-containing protein [Myxococcus sp. MISCRS1]MCY0998171.1 AsmA family protein [Myxococcus sp. MISCRS1]
MNRRAPSHHHALKVALGVVAVALVLLVVALAVKPSWLGERLRGQVETVATRALGHKVTLEKLDAHWFPRPGATLTNLRAEGEGDEPVFIEAPRASATVQLWPLVRSLGKDVRVGAVKLEAPRVNLVRREDGTWNYEAVGKAPGGSSAEEGRETSVEALRIRDGVVQVTDRQAAGGTAVAVLQDLDVDLEHVGPGLPLEGSLKGAVAAAKQNVDVDFKVDPLPTRKPEPGQPWPTVTMHLRGRDLSVRAFRDFLPPSASASFTGGLVDVDAQVKTDAGHYVLSGHGAAKGLRLRGDPASGSFDFGARVDPANPRATKLDFTRLALSGPGVELGGTASVQVAPVRVRFALEGKELDLSHLLGALPPESQAQSSSAALPASLRARLEKVEVDGVLGLGSLRHGALQATDVRAQAKLDDGVLVVQRGEATVYGGRADLSGTKVDLTKSRPAWTLKADLEGMDTARAFQALSDQSSLQGRASGELHLVGQGLDWATQREHVTGGGSVRLRDGALSTADLGATLAPVLARGLTQLGQPGSAERVQKAGKGTRLRDLSARFDVRDGWVSFSEPMAFQSDLGDGTLKGRVGLDQRLELEGTVEASKDFVSSLTGGVVPVKAPVSIPLTITGTLKEPKVSAGSPTDIAKGLLPAVPKALEDPVNQARKGLGDLFRRPRK